MIRRWLDPLTKLDIYERLKASGLSTSEVIVNRSHVLKLDLIYRELARAYQHGHRKHVLVQIETNYLGDVERVIKIDRDWEARNKAWADSAGIPWGPHQKTWLDDRLYYVRRYNLTGVFYT